MLSNNYSAKQKVKYQKNDKAKPVLTIGHENNQIPEKKYKEKRNLYIVSKFRSICNERSKNEQISLRVIYNETSFMPEFINKNVGPFVSHRRTMQRHRKSNQPTSPQTMTDFHYQLTGDYIHLPVMDNVPIYMGKTGTDPEEGITMFILRTGSTFLMDGTFAAAPSFNRECQQIYVIMGITFNTMRIPNSICFDVKKDSEAFNALFKRLLEIEPQWTPQTIIVDFKRAAMVSLKAIFNNIMIRGCWFHRMIEICTGHQNAYDIIHMLTALQLLSGDKIMEGFLSIRQFYTENVENSLPVESCRIFQRYFQYYKSTYVFKNIIYTLYRTKCTHLVHQQCYLADKLLEVSHQHLRMHMKGLITYSSGVLANYNLAIDDHQQTLDLASRLLAEGRYTVYEFLAFTKHVILNFGVVRPMHIVQLLPLPEIQPVVENRQPVNTREFILERWPIVDGQINILHLIYGLDNEEDENIPRPVLPNNTYISLEDLTTIEPIISESCYICHHSMSTVIAVPCRHKELCAPCHQTYIRMPPYRTIPYYRCPLCKGEITIYFIIV
ncbi:hypothetical protein QTP88_018471 [Uroleucon formosanum]